MKIYAIQWVMSSYIDSHLKELFANNSQLKILGFIFPEVKIPQLYDAPIYDISTAPIDNEAIYVDFSFTQMLDSTTTHWSLNSDIKIYSIREFMTLLYSLSKVPNQAYYINGTSLYSIRNVSFSSELLVNIEILSLRKLLNILNIYQNLDFRSLHKIVEIQTIEGFVLNIIKDFNRKIIGGIINVYLNGFDIVAAQLSKVHFAFREIQKLNIYLEGENIYEITGRDQNPRLVSVNFVSASKILEIEKTLSPEAYILVHLEDGLLDMESILLWIHKLKYQVKKIEFVQVSSKLSDAFLSCQLVKEIDYFSLNA